MLTFSILFNPKNGDSASLALTLRNKKIILQGCEIGGIIRVVNGRIFLVYLSVKSVFPFSNKVVNWFFDSGEILEFSSEAHKCKTHNIPIICWIYKSNKTFKEIAIWHLFAEFSSKFSSIHFNSDCLTAVGFDCHFRPDCLR